MNFATEHSDFTKSLALRSITSCYGARGNVLVLTVVRKYGLCCAEAHVAEFARCVSVDSSYTVLLGALQLCCSICVKYCIQSQLNTSIYSQ